MDIIGERVFSLIPKKPDGKYKHGAKADFARSLGFKNGAIVCDWESGKSDSYKKYLYQISALYHVSVAWLKGETDDPTVEAESAKKAPDPKTGGVSGAKQKLYDAIANLTDEQCTKLLGVVEWAKENK